MYQAIVYSFSRRSHAQSTGNTKIEAAQAAILKLSQQDYKNYWSELVRIKNNIIYYYGSPCGVVSWDWTYYDKFVQQLNKNI